MPSMQSSAEHAILRCPRPGCCTIAFQKQAFEASRHVIIGKPKESPFLPFPLSFLPFVPPAGPVGHQKGAQRLSLTAVPHCHPKGPLTMASGTQRRVVLTTAVVQQWDKTP